MNITIIGAGNIGGALARGWARSSLVLQGQAAVADNGAHLTSYFQSHIEEHAIHFDTLNITLTARTQRTLDRYASFPNLRCTLDNVEAIREADVIVLAVEPWIVPQVAEELRDHIDPDTQAVCSLAAGVGLAQLDEWFKRELYGHVTAHPTRLYCCMPNIAAEFGESMTFITRADGAPEDPVVSLFRLVGEVHVCKEKMMGPGMVMSGCGIAYVMRYLRATMAAGLEMGFYPADARAIALQTMQGAVTLLRTTGEHPEAAIDRVATPGGKTIKGLNELDHAGFNSAVIRCIKAGLQ